MYRKALISAITGKIKHSLTTSVEQAVSTINLLLPKGFYALRFFIFAFISPLIFTACSPFGPVKTTPPAQYPLTVYSIPSLAATPSAQTVLVSAPLASPGYQTKQMRYSEGADQPLRAFANSEWVAPPAYLLQPLLVQSLRYTGYFRAVIASPQVANTDWRLDTQLLALRQDFFLQGSQICLILQAQVINTKNNKVVAQRRFSAVVNALQRNPQGGVVAANQATQQVLQQLSQFVVATVSTRVNY